MKKREKRVKRLREPNDIFIFLGSIFLGLYGTVGFVKKMKESGITPYGVVGVGILSVLWIPATYYAIEEIAKKIKKNENGVCKAAKNEQRKLTHSISV